jgi:hypothetical protein
LADRFLDQAADAGFTRLGDQVYEPGTAAPIMTLSEFVYFCITPFDHHAEEARHLFATQEAVGNVVRILSVDRAHDPRFPRRPDAAVAQEPVAAA